MEHPVEKLYFFVPLSEPIDPKRLQEKKKDMWGDILLQLTLTLVSVFMFLLMYNVPQKALAKLRLRSRANTKARHHFVQGAQLLARARSATNRHEIATLARAAADEADKSTAIDPKDAAPHILKALALEIEGYKTSALDSIDVALSPLAVKSLGDGERGDALFKRAELKLGLNRRGRVDSVVADLTESLRLKSDNGKAFCLLGECYEMKKMTVEARRAYEEALRVEPNSVVAREALSRLES